MRIVSSFFTEMERSKPADAMMHGNLRIAAASVCATFFQGTPHSKLHQSNEDCRKSRQWNTEKAAVAESQPAHENAA